jgi:hypothetical protein
MDIKERILYLAENKGISKQKFFHDLDLNYGNFKGSAKKSALGTDSLVKILSKYPSVNSDWLLFGKGVMEKDEEAEVEPEVTKMIATEHIFICHSRRNTSHLDRQHTCFGKVVEGLDVIDAIKAGDKIQKITVIEEEA